MVTAPKLRALFDSVLESLCTAFGVVMGGLIILMCTDIALRQLGVGSLPWLIELTEYVMYAGTFLAAPWVLHQGAHVRVDALLNMLPASKAIVLGRIVDLTGFGIALVLLWYGSDAVLDAFSNQMVQYKTWSVPEGVLLLPIPISGLLIAIVLALRIFRRNGAVDDLDPTRRVGI